MRRTDGRVAFFAPDIHVPLNPFMGIMAVAPAPVVGQPGVTVPGVQSSTPPGAFGGNMDVKDLKAGTTLYLPVFHPGALFYTGDPHGAQGDGEVSGTAVEQSLTGTFRFVVHKGRTISGPRAETDTHYMIMGIDLDLDRAMRNATWGSRGFSGKREGPHRSESPVAGEHRRRFPRRRSRGPHAGRRGLHPKGHISRTVKRALVFLVLSAHALIVAWMELPPPLQKRLERDACGLTQKLAAFTSSRRIERAFASKGSLIHRRVFIGCGQHHETRMDA